MTFFVRFRDGVLVADVEAILDRIERQSEAALESQVMVFIKPAQSR